MGYVVDWLRCARRNGLAVRSRPALSSRRPGRDPRRPGATLIARFQGIRGAAISQFRGYELKVRGNGAWQVVANGPAAVTLASGSVTAARAYTLSLSTRGSIISARIDGVPVATRD